MVLHTKHLHRATFTERLVVTKFHSPFLMGRSFLGVLFLFYMRRSLFFSLFSFGLIYCTKPEPITPSPSVDKLAFEHQLITANLVHDSLGFKSDSSNFKLTPTLDEASGIVHSNSNPNMFWLHEDSGSGAHVYLYNAKGERQQRYSVTDISARDYEDIAIITTNGISTVYLGDIGDNNKSRKNIAIYAFEEPVFTGDSLHNQIDHVLTYNLTYPNAEAHNCEAFFMDPVTEHLWLFTKAKGMCKVFTVDLHANATTLSLVGEINIRFQEITAADISSNGQHIAIKSYEYVYYWERIADEGISQTFQKEPLVIPYSAEVQGEAFAWISADRYVTISEAGNGIAPKLQFYQR